jgi:hypothetical protein
MKCESCQDLFAGEWDGTISETDRVRLELHLAGCPACREERESLKRLWARLAAIPSEEPSPALRPRFYAMLEGYQEGLGRSKKAAVGPGAIGSWFGRWFALQPALQFGLAVVLLVAGFLTGYVLHPATNGHEEMAGLRQEVHEMRQMVTISLLKQQSASDRLKGVSLTSQVARPDPEFLSTLIHTLNYDPNVDVRLAAVDALSRFAGDPAVRNGLVKSLPKQESPMVQISLIDLLVQLHDPQSIDVLRQLIEDTSQNQQVRQRAQWGLQKLS